MYPIINHETTLTYTLFLFYLFLIDVMYLQTSNCQYNYFLGNSSDTELYYDCTIHKGLQYNLNTQFMKN